jgi:radical SAM protein with 4Fe4S-binding SPASM domain
MMKMEKCLASIYGEKYEKYRDVWNNSNSTVSFPTYPIHLNIGLNYGCNAKCRGCIYHLPLQDRNWQANPKSTISFNKYCEIIDEGVANGLCSIALSGWNEPLMKKDLVQFINYAKEKGIIDISFHTNGILLTKERSEELVNSGLTTIMVSIDAFNKETYKKVYQIDKLDVVKFNVLKFIELRECKELPLVLVTFVISKISKDELSEFWMFWKDKADYVRIQSFSNPFWGNDIYDKIEDEFRIETGMGITTECYSPFKRLLVESDGNVYACCSSYGLEYIVGNIYEESILSIWNGNRIKELREKVNLGLEKTIKNCMKCRYSLVSKGFLLK